MSVAPSQRQSAVLLVLLTRVSPGRALAPCRPSLTSQRLRSRGAGQGMAFPGARRTSPLPGTEGLWADSAEPRAAPRGPLLLSTCPSDGRPLSLPGADHRYMSSYANSYGNEWSAPDTMKRYSMYLTPKSKREHPLPRGHRLRDSAGFRLARVTVTGFAPGSPGTHLLSLWIQEQCPLPPSEASGLEINYRHLPLLTPPSPVPASSPHTSCASLSFQRVSGLLFSPATICQA